MLDYNTKQYILSIGFTVQRGCYAPNIICPFCVAKHEKSFSIGRSASGNYIVYRCWRAKCSARGRISSNMSRPESNANKTTRRTEKHKNENYIWSPIFNIIGELVGWSGRRRRTSKFGPKCLLDIRDDEQRGSILHFPKRKSGRSLGQFRFILIVEDMVSAEKADKQIIELEGRCCAILGTNINKNKLDIITKVTDMLIIALDNDATSKSYQFKNKYNLLFKNGVHVLPLNIDIKDDHENEYLVNLKRLLNGK